MSDKPSFPLALAYLIDALNSWFGKACAWLTVFLVIGTAVVVVLRYGFGIGATALQEAVLYAHALVFMGAAAWVLQRNGHVRVDIFYQKFSGRRQALVEILGNLLFLLPVALFLGWASWDYVSNSGRHSKPRASLAVSSSSICRKASSWYWSSAWYCKVFPI